jgi:hypothetical protein
MTRLRRACVATTGAQQRVLGAARAPAAATPRGRPVDGPAADGGRQRVGRAGRGRMRARVQPQGRPRRRSAQGPRPSARRARRRPVPRGRRRSSRRRSPGPSTAHAIRSEPVVRGDVDLAHATDDEQERTSRLLLRDEGSGLRRFVERAAHCRRGRHAAARRGFGPDEAALTPRGKPGTRPRKRDASNELSVVLGHATLGRVAVGLAFGLLARDVVLRLGVAASARDRHAMDGGVDLAVAAAVEAVAVGAP